MLEMVKGLEVQDQKGKTDDVLTFVPTAWFVPWCPSFSFEM